MTKTDLRRIEIDQKISSALTSLGLTFAEAYRIVRYNSDVKTACWKYYPSTGDEVIELGDLIVDLSVQNIEMVLRHEFLHRSVYHGFGEQSDDPEISNITLDVCINRLLFEAFPDAMKELSDKVYPRESKLTVIALADCTADPFQLTEPLKSLWISIWEKPLDGGFHYLNPASLYFRLVELHDPKAFLLNPFSDFARVAPGFSGNIPERIIRAGSKIIEGVSRNLPNGSSGGSELNRYSVIPRKIGVSAVEQFLCRINVRTIVTPFASKIRKPLLKGILLQPFPLYPTRLGYVYQVLGLTDTLRLYWNKDIQSTGERMAIGFYVDVSGSMVTHFSLLSGFVDALREFPIRVFSFDTSVREVDIDEFGAGKIMGGGGTDFDCVIKDLMGSKDIVAAIIFTDGYGDFTEALAQGMLRNGKKLYLVWVRNIKTEGCSPLLKKYVNDTLELEINDSMYKIVN